MKYGSMFSGIEAASVAWKPLGWDCQFVAEIEPFPSAVLAHHYPDVPNLGDVTKVDWDEIRTTRPVDLLVFGSPCQSFSVAGKRLGLDDPRGNLALYALAVVNKLRPRWFVFENVPGLLSSGGGRDFGQFLATVGECGYQCAWRILDAQYVRVESHSRAVPQRRRRVFVVGYLGDWRRAAAVLFERESLLGHPAPRREAGQGVATSIVRSVALRGREGGGVAELGDEVGLTLRASGGGGDKAHVLIPGVARALTTSNQRIDAETETLLVAHALRGEGFDASEDGTGRGTPIVPVADTLTSHWHQSNGASAGNNSGMINPVIHGGASVRRLTPLECERLQGFPDRYTRVPINRGAGWAADGPRYKAIGNSMAVNVMRHIGERIQLVEQLMNKEAT